MNIKRRQFLIGTTALGLGAVCSYALSEQEPEVISVVAKKFEYSLSEIHLKKDIPVILEFTSLDVIMGFSVPDFKTRIDIFPGTKTRLLINPDKVGTFTFYCDIFCGSGHEDMNGVLIIS